MTLHLVETSEEDSLLAVIHHVADLLNEGQTKTALAETPGSRFANECTELLSESKNTELLKKIFSQTEVLLSKASSSDAECCLFVALHLVPRSEQQELAVVKHVAEQLVAKAGEHDDVRLSVLINLFNICQLQQAKQLVLSKVLALVQKSRPLAQSLVTQIRVHGDTVFKSLNLKGQLLRDFYLGCAGALKVAGDKSSVREYVRLISAALASAKANETAALESLKPYAAAAISEFIRSTDVFGSDIKDLPAVSQLAKDKNYAPLYELYTTMLTGSFEGFQSAAVPSLLEQVGISPEAAQAKMRHMALLAVVSDSAGEPLPFENIQKALGVGEDEVEAWIVRAVGRKLIEGKIDQVSRVFVPSKCTFRTFGSEEWKKLQLQLGSWCNTLASVQNTIVASQLPSGPRRAASVPSRA